MSFQLLHFDFILDLVLVSRNILLLSTPITDMCSVGSRAARNYENIFSQRRKVFKSVNTASNTIHILDNVPFGNSMRIIC